MSVHWNATVATIPPNLANHTLSEIEFHPYVLTHLQPLLAIHRQRDIVTQAYASLVPTTRHTAGPLNPVLERISKDVGCDASGVLLLWVIAKGGVCITSSSDEERIKKIAAVDELRDLTAEEVQEIDRVGGSVHFRQWVS